MPEGHTEIRRSPKQYFDQSQGVVALRSGLAPVSWTGESLGSDYLIWRHVALLFETFFGSAPGGAFFRPDPHDGAAVAHSGGQGRPFFGPPAGLVLDGREHDGRLVFVGID